MMRRFRWRCRLFSGLLRVVLVACGAGAGVASEAPQPNAGEDQKLTLPGPNQTVSTTLNGTVQYSGSGSLTFRWVAVSGPDLVVFSAEESALTQATFQRAGEYVLRLKVSDGSQEGSDDLTVKVGPDFIEAVVGKAEFFAAGAGVPRSWVSFTMTGVNLAEKRLDLQPSDRFVITFGGLAIGGFDGPPASDFVRMDARNKPRTTNGRGETFDSGAVHFGSLKARYRADGLGRLQVTASGGDFDPALLPQPQNGEAATATIFVTVQVERVEYGETLIRNFYHEITVTAAPARGGTRGGIAR